MDNNNNNQTAIAALLNLVQAVNNLNQTVAAVFPQTLSTVGTATGGAATLPANPEGFLSVLNTDGTIALIPYYNT